MGARSQWLVIILRRLLDLKPGLYHICRVLTPKEWLVLGNRPCHSLPQDLFYSQMQVILRCNCPLLTTSRRLSWLVCGQDKPLNCHGVAMEGPVCLLHRGPMLGHKHEQTDSPLCHLAADLHNSNHNNTTNNTWVTRTQQVVCDGDWQPTHTV